MRIVECLCCTSLCCTSLFCKIFLHVIMYICVHKCRTFCPACSWLAILCTLSTYLFKSEVIPNVASEPTEEWCKAFSVSSKIDNGAFSPPYLHQLLVALPPDLLVALLLNAVKCLRSLLQKLYSKRNPHIHIALELWGNIEKRVVPPTGDPCIAVGFFFCVL